MIFHAQNHPLAIEMTAWANLKTMIFLHPGNPAATISRYLCINWQKINTAESIPNQNKQQTNRVNTMIMDITSESCSIDSTLSNVCDKVDTVCVVLDMALQGVLLIIIASTITGGALSDRRGV